jgi:L-seryl-tRNA(Ser) seleniumtransferase
MDEATRDALRRLPSVEELLSHPATGALLERYPRGRVVDAVRATVEAARRAILADEAAADAGATSGAGSASGTASGGAAAAPDTSPEAILDQTEGLLESWSLPGLRHVINLTGVVIHTNLGRSPLAEAAIDRVAGVSRGYSNLEYELEAG